MTSLRRALVVLAVPAFVAVTVPAASAVAATPAVHQVSPSGIGLGGFPGCCPV
ncbi:MAG TPA: hypothetical protein VGI74_23735 [Streptosporangiaceae bacterium]|jgi:hypothetical protein